MSASAPRKAAARLYRDYLQPDRLAAFAGFLTQALDAGYQTMTLTTFAAAVARGDGTLPPRVLLVRHDVDSDVPRARRMREIERGLGTVGTYFFRRMTWDVALMRELEGDGCDVGYHYEELATLVKELGATEPAQARALIPAARERLRRALAELRAASGLALDVLAAHGDFANRAVQVSNVELLDDAAFRAEIGARLEAYDVEEHVHARASDNAWPGYWEPEDPAAALARGAPVVEVLIHPRAWGRSPVANARADARRVLEGARFSLRGRARTAERRRADSADPTDPNRSTRRRRA
jgi:hypothetical protein